MTVSASRNLQTGLQRIRAIHIGDPRVFSWALLLIAILATIGVTQATRIRLSITQDRQALAESTAGQFAHVLSALHVFDQSLADAKIQGVDVVSVESLRPQVVALMMRGEYADAALNLLNLSHQLQALRDAKAVADQAASDAARPSAVDGIIKNTSGQVLSQVLIELRTDTTVAQATTNAAGQYHVEALAGTYALKATKSGYISKQQSNVVLAPGGSQVIDLTLSVPSPSTSTTPPPTSEGSSGSSDSSTSDGNSSYSLMTVGTSRGDFTAHVMTFNLNAGARVKTATGNDDDCSDNCVVKSLSSYVSEGGGSSGINGTYFCPPDYGATCDGQTNAYFWKVYKTSLGKLINGTNGLGNLDPMIAFTSGGQAQYFSTWDSWKNSGFATYAGMNSKPRLVEGGSNILNEGGLDSNQKSVKGNRGAIGLSGQTFWAVIVKSATVPDLAAVMNELGVEYAINIDGGGSSAMIYKGSYKVGPGRQLPNAVVIEH